MVLLLMVLPSALHMLMVTFYVPGLADCSMGNR